MSATAPLPSIKITSSDNKILEIDELTLRQSVTLGGLADAFGLHSEVTIPLNNIDAETLMKVFTFCWHHKNDTDEQKVAKEPISDWDKGFFSGMSNETLNKIALATNYLDIPTLTDHVALQLSSFLSGKSTAEMREALYGRGVVPPGAPAPVPPPKKIAPKATTSTANAPEATTSDAKKATTPKSKKATAKRAPKKAKASKKTTKRKATATKGSKAKKAKVVAVEN